MTILNLVNIFGCIVIMMMFTFVLIFVVSLACAQSVEHTVNQHFLLNDAWDYFVIYWWINWIIVSPFRQVYCFHNVNGRRLKSDRHKRLLCYPIWWTIVLFSSRFYHTAGWTVFMVCTLYKPWLLNEPSIIKQLWSMHEVPMKHAWLNHESTAS